MPTTTGRPPSPLDPRPADDPYTARLRAWARDQGRSAPSQDGDVIMGPGSVVGGLGGGGAMRLPRAGATERLGLGKAEGKGAVEGREEKGKKRGSFARWFHRGREEGEGEEDVIR
ncbi:hypothetical protein MMC11_008034 [Xylographa trunciseda]|nr:hypothetical protein [Xylographa trunciseda]